MSRRFVFPLLAALALLVPLTASAQHLSPKRWVWETVQMRSTTAGNSVARHGSWLASGSFSSGYTDSSVFREGTWAAGVVDTSVAISVENLFWPPSLLGRASTDGLNRLVTRTNADPSQHGPSGSDSLITFLPDTLDNNRWVTVRVVQDTVSNAFAGATGFDSVLVAAQWSEDGVNWLSVYGTPTRAYNASEFAVNPTDGKVPHALAEAEDLAGNDGAEVDLECQPTIYTGGAALIINRTLCMASGHIRFLIGVPGATGQFKVQLGHWE